jgi:putative ABC transport system ATP-binding protein
MTTGEDNVSDRHGQNPGSGEPLQPEVPGSLSPPHRDTLSSSPILEARGLHRSFGTGAATAVVLRDVSLELYPSEVLLLMGPSGSGKSTLLAVLSGLLRPDSGEVMALGQNLWQLSERAQREFRLRHCGFIFQGFNLFPSLTAREQLEMVLRWGEGLSGREARRRVSETLELLGLSRRGDLRADQLSGGEKQRVAVGRALLKKPTFCFADEPTSSLDWAHGEHVIRLLQAAAHERGATVFVVAHDVRLVPYADRVCYLDDGRLRAAVGSGQSAVGSRQ